MQDSVIVPAQMRDPAHIRELRVASCVRSAFLLWHWIVLPTGVSSWRPRCGDSMPAHHGGTCQSGSGPGARSIRTSGRWTGQGVWARVLEWVQSLALRGGRDGLDRLHRFHDCAGASARCGPRPHLRGRARTKKSGTRRPNHAIGRSRGGLRMKNHPVRDGRDGLWCSRSPAGRSPTRSCCPPPSTRSTSTAPAAVPGTVRTEF